MQKILIVDNGFLTLKEDPSYASPISSVFYEYYESLEELAQRLERDQEQLQCIVSAAKIEGSIPLGSSQKPALWEYADQVDTLEFLLAL